MRSLTAICSASLHPAIRPGRSYSAAYTTCVTRSKLPNTSAHACASVRSAGMKRAPNVSSGRRRETAITSQSGSPEKCFMAA